MRFYFNNEGKSINKQISALRQIFVKDKYESYILK